MSHVYVAYEPGTNLYKIGRTSNPTTRQAMLRTASGHDIKILASLRFEFPDYTEKILHDKWRDNHIAREWFRLAPNELDELYLDLDKLGGDHCHCSKPCRGQAPVRQCTWSDCGLAQILLS